MNVIIIEDEPHTANDLRAILEELGSNINVLAILYSVSTAIAWLKEQPAPDLIFSDIQLGDGLCFEIFSEVQLHVPIVFCTAFDDYAIEAFESYGIDYLLKPIEEEKVERSLLKFQRIKDYFQSGPYSANLDKLLVRMDAHYKQSLLVHFREKIIPVKVADIRYIYASNGVVILYTTYQQSYVVQHTIDSLESMLNPQIFYRANRQFIVNREAIQNIELYFNRRLVVKLLCDTPVKLVVSRLKAQDFLNWIEK